MRIRILWLVGLVCTLLVVAMSPKLDHRTRLATAEAFPLTREPLRWHSARHRRAAAPTEPSSSWRPRA